MKRLILVRHGETTFLRDNPGNPQSNDASLTDTGVRQIELVRERLKSETPGVILTSTLKRAVESADILNERYGVKIIQTASLDEFAVDEDGKGTESTESGLIRATDALNTVRKDYDSVMLVGHNSLLTLLMASILNAPYAPSESKFEEPGNYHILSYDWEAGEQMWSSPSFSPI